MNKFVEQIRKIKINKKWLIVYLISFGVLAGGAAVPIYSFYAKYETDDAITKSTKDLSRKLKLNYSKITQKHLLVASPKGKTHVSIKALHNKDKNEPIIEYNKTFIVPQYSAIKIPLLPGKFALKIVSEPHKSLKNKKEIINKSDLTISKVLEYKDNVIKIVSDLPKDIIFSEEDSFNDKNLRHQIKTFTVNSEEWKKFEQSNFSFLDNIDDFFKTVINPWNVQNKNDKIIVGVTKGNKKGSTQEYYKNNPKSLLINGFPKNDTLENRKSFFDVATGTNSKEKRLSGFKEKIEKASEFVVEWAINFEFPNNKLKISLIKSLNQTNSLTGVNFKNMMSVDFQVFGTIAEPKKWANEDGFIVEKIQGKPYTWLYKKADENKNKKLIDKFKEFVKGVL